MTKKSTLVHIVITLFLLLYENPIWAQQYTEVLFQPKVAININSGKFYSQNFSVSHRAFLFQGDWVYKGRQFQVSHFSTLAITPNEKISLGVMYRNLDVFDTNMSNEIRLTQQYNHSNKPAVVRYSHRIRTEERFRGQRTTYRLRYRFGVDLPLQGQKLNSGEYYGLANLEFVCSLEKSLNPQYEGRFTLGIGKMATTKTKFQFMLQYRNLDVKGFENNQLFSLMEVHFKL